MKYKQIKNNLFIKNRDKLRLKLKPNSLVVFLSNKKMYRNGDQFFDFRQNSDFFYFSGIDQEESFILLYPNHENEEFREVLFVIETNKKIKVWEGPKYSKQEAKEVSGIRNVKWINEFDNIFKKLIKDADNVYFNDFPSSDNNLIDIITNSFPNCNIEKLTPISASLRIKKEQEEIALMQQACDITGKAFSRILAFVKPSVMEYEIEAEISGEFIRNRANGNAFPSIVASGKNACILHYINNNNICKSGDLLLMDFGAEYANYAADCSRTIPVSGQFNKRQKECYEAVLRVMKFSISLMLPGTNIQEIHTKTCRMLQDEHVKLGLYTENDIKNQDEAMPLWKKYYPHGTSHFIGIDVHDVGDKTIVLEEGMVLSCEPGLYIPEENIGIRIEDDIVVGNPPRNLLQNVPKEVFEIENFMNGKNSNI
ncbi:MAG: aminopeptidase P family protein [Bacteroidales bacterium]|jgi:Xaa-Pro aminopeptidase|nr:aminopeptidase P family protein [Bacteroidales bacterium]